MKQEIWRFDRFNRLRKVGGHYGWIDWLASANNGLWCVHILPQIAGVHLKLSGGEAKTTRAGRRLCALEIKCQLAAHGVEVEIREVSK